MSLDVQIDSERLLGAFGATALAAGAGGDALGSIGTGLLYYAGEFDEPAEEPSILGAVPWWAWLGGAALVGGLIWKAAAT